MVKIVSSSTTTDASTQPWRCCPRGLLSSSLTSSHTFPNSPQTQANYSHCCIPKPPESPPSPILGAGTVKEAAPSISSCPKSGVIPLTSVLQIL